MDELQISGKRFISSRRIARDNGYTSDYIGQLIRGGKVTGQKVGRAWYVDAASFNAFLGEEGVSSNLSDEVLKSETPEQRSSDLPASSQTPGEQVGARPFAQEFPISAPVADSVSAVVLAEEKEEKIPEPEIAPAVIEPVTAPVAVEEVVKEEETQHIPLRLIKSEAPGGLKYYTDDAPSLPEIHSGAKESRIDVPAGIEGDEPKEAFESQDVRRVRKGPLFALAAAGVAVFIFSAVVSSSMSLNLSIEAGNAAATSYSLNW